MIDWLIWSRICLYFSRRLTSLIPNFFSRSFAAMRASCKRENRVIRDGIIVTWFQNLWKSACQKILKEASPTYRSWNLSTVVFVHQIENLLDVLENDSNDAKKQIWCKKIENLVGQLIFGLVRSFTPPCLFQLIHHFLFWKIRSHHCLKHSPTFDFSI